MVSLLALFTFAHAGQDVKPQPYEPEIAAIVADMLGKEHYTERAADDALSQAWFDAWLDMLDYQRMMLLDSDVSAFRAKRNQLDDMLKSSPPDLSLATQMFETARKRLGERNAFAVSLLDGSLDLTDDESWVPDRNEQKVGFAKSSSELDDVWRQRVQNDLIGSLLVECGTDTPECFVSKRGEVEERLKKRYNLQVKNYDDLESTDVLEMYLGALAGVFDPHTVWFAPARNDNFDIDITNSVEGIGAQLWVKEGYTTVENVIAGGPADQHGELKAGDKIIAVAQGDDEPVDIVDWRIDKVVKLIRGAKGSDVRLLVRPADKGPTAVSEIRITRDRVNLAKSAVAMSYREVNGKKLAVIDVPSFYVPAERGSNGASGDVKDLLKKASAEGAEGVLLDLSMNGGGSLREAVEMAGLFITTGPVVQIRDRHARVSPLYDPDSRQIWTGPLVVLTSQASASASEIVAGALQDYGRGLIVGGAQTHGKGTVQQVADVTRLMRDARKYDEGIGGALKVTIQKFYRVSGGSTQLKGVVPDLVLPTPWDGLDVLEGDLDSALVWDEIPPIPHSTAGGFASVLPALEAASKKRVEASEDFQKLAVDVAEREKRRADPTVSLNIEARRAEFAAATAEEKLEDEANEALEDDTESRTPKMLLDEGVNVLADLVAAKG